MVTPDRIGAVVVNYNAGQTLDRCLRSLAGEPLAGVRVVDNDSKDGSQAKVPSGWLLQSDVNLGFARAVNLGVSSFGADISVALLLNPDAWLLPRALATLASALRAGPHTAVAGPLVVDANGLPTVSARRFPRSSVDLVERLRLSRLFPADTRRRLIQGPLLPHSGGPFPVDWLSGACLMIDMAAWNSIGPMCEDFFLYGEDLDWCWRAARAGYRRIYVPDAHVQHLGGVSAATTMSTTKTKAMVRDGVRLACVRNMRKSSYLAWRVSQAW